MPRTPHRPRRRLLLLIPLILGLAILYPILRDQLTPLPPDPIHWRTDFAVAKAEALASQKPLLLDFTATWCGTCQTMRRNVWPNPQVASLINDHFIPVHLDVDLDTTQPIAQNYRVEVIPTLILLSPTGEFRSSTNSCTARELLNFLAIPSTVR